MAEKIKLADRQHPLYAENVDLWNLYLDAAKGGNQFINDENIFSHRLEDSEDYDERIDRAYYLNFCEVIPKLYNIYIFKERIERPPNDSLESFRNNVDGKGHNMNYFMKKAGFFASLFGAMHVFVDIPQVPKKVPTKADEKNTTPFCRLVYPTQLRDWSIDENGNWNWVIIESTYYKDLDPTKERVIEKHYKLITTTDWRVEDQDGKPVKYEDGTPNKGTNTLGFVPLHTLYHVDIDDDKVGESLIKDIVYINRAILNWCSCIDEQIERQTFSQLVIPDSGESFEDSDEDPLRKVGSGSIFTFPHDASHPPAFISPDTSTLTTIWELVIDHIKEIYRIAGLMGSTNDMYVGTSGRAAQMGFIGVNSALADKAYSYQAFENDISKLALLHLGKNINEYEDVRYSDSFDISSLADEVDTFFNIMEKEFSTRLNKTLMKSISRKAAPLAPQSVRDEIEREIESGDGTVKSASIREKELFDKGEGPKDTDIKDNTKSKAQIDKEQRTHRKE